MRVVAATPTHLAALAGSMRPEDIAEVGASGGYTPSAALEASRDASEFTHALLIDDQLAMVFGVAYGSVIWALTSTLVEKRQRTFAHASRAIVHDLLRVYPVLQNMVDARYAKALRWAKWVGFTVGDPEPFGVSGLPFRKIEIRRKHV